MPNTTSTESFWAKALPYLITGGTALASGIVGSRAAKSAANTQTAANVEAARIQQAGADKALDFQERAFAQIQKNLAPFFGTGQIALQALARGMGLPLPKQTQTATVAAGNVPRGTSGTNDLGLLYKNGNRPQGTNADTFHGIISDVGGMAGAGAGIGAFGGPVGAGIGAAVGAGVGLLANVTNLFHGKGGPPALAQHDSAVANAMTADAKTILEAKDSGKISPNQAAQALDELWNYSTQNFQQGSWTNSQKQYMDAWKSSVQKQIDDGYGDIFVGGPNAGQPASGGGASGGNGEPGGGQQTGTAADLNPDLSGLPEGDLSAPWTEKFDSSKFNFDPSKYSFTAPDPKAMQNDPAYQNRLAEGAKIIERSAAARGGAVGGATIRALNRFAQGEASNEFDKIYGRALTENTVRFNRDLNANETDYGRAKNDYTTHYNEFRQNQKDRFDRLATLAGFGTTATAQANTAEQNNANNSGNIVAGTAKDLGDLYATGESAQAAGTIGSANSWGNAISSLGNQLADLYNRKYPPVTPTQPRKTGY